MIRLLGDVDFGVEVPMAAQRVAAFLAVNHHRRFDRQEVADELMIARKTLRQYLWALGPIKDVVIREDPIIRWDGHVTDVQKLEEGDHAVYRGPLLPGWTDEWAVLHRARLEMVYLDRIHNRAAHLYRTGDLQEAHDLLEGALRMVPDDGPTAMLLEKVRSAERMAWINDY